MKTPTAAFIDFLKRLRLVPTTNSKRRAADKKTPIERKWWMGDDFFSDSNTELRRTIKNKQLV